MNRNLLHATWLVPILTACAVLPDATITYYLPKSRTTITVTQTIACDSSKNPNVTLVLNVKPTYMADYSDAAKERIAIKALDSAMSDTDVAVALTEDGRLKSINSTQTGEAEAVIKEVVTVAATVAALGVVPTAKGKPNWCESPTAEKPVTITYKAGPYEYKDLVFASDTPKDMTVDSSSQALYDAVSKTSLGASLKPGLGIHAAQTIQPVEQKNISDGVPVALPRMSKVQIELFWGAGASASVDTQDLFLPSEGTDRTFMLYIPSSAMFGTQKFVLSLTDSGAISSIQYAKTTGAASALTATQDVLNPLKPESTADRAAVIKAQADLIYEQQRLAGCRANPAACK